MAESENTVESLIQNLKLEEKSSYTKEEVWQILKNVGRTLDSQKAEINNLQDKLAKVFAGLENESKLDYLTKLLHRKALLDNVKKEVRFLMQ
ncbi:MAG: hypothetical protein AAF518_29025 [Spirochaetota bacterium]